MRHLFRFLTVSLFAFGFQSLAQESVEDALASALQGFAQDRVAAIKLSCSAPARGPASVTKTQFISYEVNSTQQGLKVESVDGNVSAVALMGDSIEFSRWKTFVPSAGKFQVDAAGNGGSVSELIFNSQKANYIKALELLAPKILECCSNNSCSRRLADY